MPKYLLNSAMATNCKKSCNKCDCADVTCKVTVDNVVTAVKYNDNALQITGGAVDVWEQGKVSSFQSCSDSSPGILEIKGKHIQAKIF